MSDSQAIPQSGILPDANSNALFICLNITDLEASRALLQQFSQTIESLQQRFADAALSAVIGVGSQCWNQLFNQRPAELVDFKAFSANDVSAPHTPVDLLIHIRSERHDVNFETARSLLKLAPNAFEVVDEVHGFRYLDSRDLTGFVDGTENPQGEQRTSVALVPQAEPFAAGSYIHIQRYVHQLAEWEQLSCPHQEDIIGRTKADNVEYASADKALTAHIKRVNLKYEDGRSKEILRHSMPYGSTSEHGLFFVSYAATPSHFNDMLQSMIEGEGEHYDHLMRYTQAVSGAAFFAPDIQFLENQDNYR